MERLSMNRSKMDGPWFREENLEWEGFSQSLQFEEILYNKPSEFQDIMVFRNRRFGKVLVLDGAVQLTEKDEFMYHEMMAHIPMSLINNPEKVLVVGGGDGGVVREVLKYDSVKEVVLCELDKDVIEVCKQFIPLTAGSLSDPRVNIQVGDGMEYVRHHPNEFDVIITDSPDPEGQARGLYQNEFFGNIKNCLKDDGVACWQGEVMFLDIEFTRSMLSQCKANFPCVGFAVGNIPTCITGCIGYLLARKNKDIDLSQPIRKMTDADIQRMKLKYYNSDVHHAAFQLPTYGRKALAGFLDT